MNAIAERQGVTLRRADGTDSERWNDIVEQSHQATPFHRYEALEVLADHSGSTLLPLVGFKGQEPVGVLPLFVITKGPVSTAFSPPPGLWVPMLGPALVNSTGLKQRKAEKRNGRLVEGAIEWLRDEYGPRYTHVATDRRYPDPRPFEWNGFECTLRYTYVVDLAVDDEEDLFMSFSGDARRNVRAVEDSDYGVREGDAGDVERIVEQVRARHEEQDEPYTVEPAFVASLFRELPEGTVRPYVVERGGTFVSGMVALAFGDRVDRWQGGVKPGGDHPPVNDLLDWRIMRDAVADDLREYDLMGANERRLCEYKAKFDPEVATYHSLTDGTRGMRLLADVYRRMR